MYIYTSICSYILMLEIYKAYSQMLYCNILYVHRKTINVFSTNRSEGCELIQECLRDFVVGLTSQEKICVSGEATLNHKYNISNRDHIAPPNL